MLAIFYIDITPLQDTPRPDVPIGNSEPIAIAALSKALPFPAAAMYGGSQSWFRSAM